MDLTSVPPCNGDRDLPGQQHCSEMGTLGEIGVRSPQAAKTFSPSSLHACTGFALLSRQNIIFQTFQRRTLIELTWSVAHFWANPPNKKAALWIQNGFSHNNHVEGKRRAGGWTQKPPILFGNLEKPVCLNYLGSGRDAKFITWRFKNKEAIGFYLMVFLINILSAVMPQGRPTYTILASVRNLKTFKIH